MSWTTLSNDDALTLYNVAERDIVAADEQLISDALLDISCRVREVIATNRTNVMAAYPSIPRSFRQAALAIVRRDLLLRYDLEVSASRQQAAADAEAYLAEAKASKAIVADELGNVPIPAGSAPTVFSPAPVYFTGSGII